jgi:Tol biopolymer transport system component
VLNTPTSDSYNPSPTRDGLTVYFLSNRDTGAAFNLFVGTRTSLTSTFTVTKITTVPADIAQPCLTPSGSALYYTTDSTIVRSPIVSGAVGAPVNVGVPRDAATPAISPDELTLYYSAKNALDDWDIFMATRASTADPFGNFTPLDTVNTAAEDRPNWISEDGCELWLASKIVLDGGTNLGDIFMAKKPL